MIKHTCMNLVVHCHYQIKIQLVNISNPVNAVINQQIQITHKVIYSISHNNQ